MEPFRIHYFESQQIGPFEQIAIKFHPKQSLEKAEIHILTGANGTGKSTILEAISLTFIQNIQSKFLLSKIWTNHSRISLQTSNGNIGWFIYDGEWHNTGLPAIIAHHSEKSNKNDFSVTQFSIAVFAYSGYRRVTNTLVTGIQEITEHPLKNAVNFSLSIDPKLLLQWLVNTQTRELIAKGKGDIDKAQKYRANLDRMQQAIGEIIGSTVQFDLEEDPLQVLVRIDSQPLTFDQLPDGLKSMISWMGDLLMRMDRLKWENDTPVFDRNFILLLDEIEVHLHPAWQRKILPVVQKLFKNAQIFISTHSPFVVGSVDGAWVHRFEKKDGYSVLAGDPILSEDANSYEYILEEIFGIHERFGVQVEKELTEFRAIKQAILTGKTDYNRTRFNELIRSLSSQSTELESIIGMELKQLQRLTQQNFLTTAE